MVKKIALLVKTVDYQKKLLSKQASTIEQLLKKVAEMEEDAATLAEAASKATEKTEEIAEKVGNVAEETATTATNVATTDSVSEETKDLLIETVTNIDPELGGQLGDEIEKAEEGGLTAEKVSSLMISVLNSYGKKLKSGKQYGSAIPNKNAGLTTGGNNWENAAGAVFSKLLNNR